MGNNHAESITAETVATSAQPSRRTRRTVLLGAGAIGAAAALAACGPGSAGASAPVAAPTGPIAKTTDIPVGGGKIFTSPQVVVTQPTAGTFKAFSSICTHQGCPVNQIRNGTIMCPCHGSEYSIVDGSVTRAAEQGQAGLTVEQIAVADGEISIV